MKVVEKKRVGLCFGILFEKYLLVLLMNLSLKIKCFSSKRVNPKFFLRNNLFYVVLFLILNEITKTDDVFSFKT